MGPEQPNVMSCKSTLYLLACTMSHSIVYVDVSAAIIALGLTIKLVLDFK